MNHWNLLVWCFVVTTLTLETCSARKVFKRSDTLNSTIHRILSANNKMFEYGAFAQKIYFSEHVNMDFTTSESYCEGAGMKLVRLDSDEELAYLGLMVDNNRYWLDGYGTNEYFWVQDGGEVEYKVISSHSNCVIIDSAGKLWGDPCDGSQGFNYFPLCQLKIAEIHDTV